MTTLVTGATGLLGNNVVRLLVERGQRARVLIRAGTDLEPVAGLDVEVVRGDVCEPAAVEAACAGVQRVVHCAGRVHIGWRDLDEQRAINVEGTRNVAEAARRAKTRMVHVSSIDALGVRSDGGPVDEQTAADTVVPCTYVVTKREGECAVLQSIAQGLDAVIVNPGLMFGPWDWKPSSGRMLLEVAKGRARLAPPGANSYCDARDVAAGILAALDQGRTGQRYILAGENLEYLGVLNSLAEITGARPPWRTAIRPTMRMIGRFGDLHARLTRRESQVNSAATTMAMLPKNYSSALAERELGYHSRGLRESASDAWTWLKQSGRT